MTSQSSAHVHRRRNYGQGRILSALARRMAETAKDPSRRATPDAPERIDHRKRCTTDHRTCCRETRGVARRYCATHCENASPRHDMNTTIRDTFPCRRLILKPRRHHCMLDGNLRASSRVQSIRSAKQPDPRLLSLTNVSFWTAVFGCGSATRLRFSGS